MHINEITLNTYITFKLSIYYSQSLQVVGLILICVSREVARVNNACCVCRGEKGRERFRSVRGIYVRARIYLLPDDRQATTETRVYARTFEFKDSKVYMKINSKKD